MNMEYTRIEMIRNQYLPLLESYLNQEIEVGAFEEAYEDLRLSDKTVSVSLAMREIMVAIAEDIGAYYPEPDPARWPVEIGETELRKCLLKHVINLKAILGQ